MPTPTEGAGKRHRQGAAGGDTSAAKASKKKTKRRSGQPAAAAARESHGVNGEADEDGSMFMAVPAFDEDGGGGHSAAFDFGGGGGPAWETYDWAAETSARKRKKEEKEQRAAAADEKPGMATAGFKAKGAGKETVRDASPPRSSSKKAGKVDMRFGSAWHKQQEHDAAMAERREAKRQKYAALKAAAEEADGEEAARLGSNPDGGKISGKVLGRRRRAAEKRARAAEARRAERLAKGLPVDTERKALPAKLAVGTAAGVNALTLPGAAGRGRGDTPPSGALSEKNAKRKARREKKEEAEAAEAAAAANRTEATVRPTKAAKAQTKPETPKEKARRERREAAEELERQAAALRAEVSSSDEEEEEEEEEEVDAPAEGDWGVQFSTDEDDDDESEEEEGDEDDDDESEEEEEEEEEEEGDDDDDDESEEEEEAAGSFVPAPAAAAKTSGKMSLMDKMRAKLSGGQFRMLNEALYTTTGDRALDMVKESPGMFSAYHQGFREQTKEWPVRPVDICLKWLKAQPKSLVVADFGCGDAELARVAPQRKVHSFDLESEAPGVIACNMANVPLPDKSVDVAVFSLSLMGVDYGLFVEEAHRVLKTGGVLWIAEVRSRFDGSAGHASVDSFLATCAQLGFKRKGKVDESNKMFFIVHLVKDKVAGEEESRGKRGRKGKSGLVWPKLKPCIYKRR